MRVRGEQSPLFPLGMLSVEQIEIKLDRLEILWYNLIVIRKEIDATMSLKKKFADLTKEPNFVFIDLVMAVEMVVGAIIVWLVFGR